MKLRIAGSALVCISALATAGCIHRDSTVIQDVPRVKVEFENDLAGRLFYETLNHSPQKYSRSESTTSVAIPILLEHRRHVITGPNTAFNKAVEDCDTNGDGKITETEARIFAEQNKRL